MTPKEIKELALNSLDELKARDITVIDIAKISDIADWIIVASGNSSRQVRSSADKLVADCKKHGISILSQEGFANAEWALIDLGDVIVHIMQQQTRDYYQIEKFWQHSPSLSP